MQNQWMPGTYQLRPQPCHLVLLLFFVFFVLFFFVVVVVVAVVLFCFSPSSRKQMDTRGAFLERPGQLSGP